MGSVYAFSGEDFLRGLPWHHEDITEQALSDAAFDRRAYDTIAWHADYIDSYIYNYLWWLDLFRDGGPSRAIVSLATADELKKLHFDDLFSTDQVVQTWNRYLTGTVAGLLWAAERDDVSAAYNILGVSLHAIQDFYSHSNWVNYPELRDKTWFEVDPTQRSRTTLWTGSYERTGGIKHHGKPSPMCSALNALGADFSEFLETIACNSLSPMRNSGLCVGWKECHEAESIGFSVVEVEFPNVIFPDNVLYLSPPGIALDNTWMAAVGGRERGLLDERGNLTAEGGRNLVLSSSCEDLVGRPCRAPADTLFAMAKSRAIEASFQWISILDETMQRLGNEKYAFWNKVRSGVASAETTAEYEEYHRFPYQFLTVGPYPLERRDAGERYYLRVRLQTSDESEAGTNGDITLVADGREFLLDYLPHAFAFPSYDDFERGDNMVYTVGPLDRLPGEITLVNVVPDAGDVVDSLASGLIAAIDSGANRARIMALSLVAGGPDHIDDGHVLWTAEQLATIRTSPQSFRLTLRDTGADFDGHYDIHGRIRMASEGTDWAEYVVMLTEGVCVRESDLDRGSDSDEPFFLTSLISFDADSRDTIVGPITIDTHPEVGDADILDDILGHVAKDNVDTGDRFDPRTELRSGRIPKASGMLALAMQGWESDDENRSDREALLREFTGEVEAETSGVLATFGKTIGPDWKLAEIEVTAFTRGDTVRVGTVLVDSAVNIWIGANERRSFRLQASRLRTFPVSLADLERWPLPGREPPSSYLLSGVASPACLVPLYSWWSPERTDNFASSDPRWVVDPRGIGWSGHHLAHGPRQEGYALYRLEGHLFDPKARPPPGTVPLYSWWSRSRADNFLSSDPRWSMDPTRLSWSGHHVVNGPEKDGYRLYRLEGHVFDPRRPQPPNTVPLYSWWSPTRTDNFATSDPRWSFDPARVVWSGHHVTNGPEKDGYRLYRLEGYVYDPRLEVGRACLRLDTDVIRDPINVPRVPSRIDG